MDQSNAEQRFADYLRPLITRKWMILIAVVLTTGVVFAYYSHKPNVYTASTLVYVLNQGDPVTGAISPSTDRQVQDQATLLDSRATAAIVAHRIGFQGTPQDLLKQVALTSQPGEDFVQVTATAGSAQEAATIANGFSDSFVKLVNGSNSKLVAAALRLSQAQLDALPRGQANSATRGVLATQIER